MIIESNTFDPNEISKIEKFANNQYIVSFKNESQIKFLVKNNQYFFYFC